MSHFIMKLDVDDAEQFLIWSTIVDAPVSYGMNEAELTEWCRHEYGDKEIDSGSHQKRVDRCRKNGTSSMLGNTAEGLIEINHAGPKGAKLSREEFIDVYCRKRHAPKSGLSSGLQSDISGRFRRRDSPARFLRTKPPQ